ncbi:MAG: hypothetical protein WAZ31_09710 [Rectinemataceae bacterium]
MNADLRDNSKGKLFVIFGESDINILPDEGGKVNVKVNGVDVFHPNTREVHSDGTEGIAFWFIDSDYNEESFFVHQTYFPGYFSGSSGRQRLDMEASLQCETALTPKAKIREFTDRMDSIRPKFQANFMQRRTLARLRDTLLPKLMSIEAKAGT